MSEIDAHAALSGPAASRSRHGAASSRHVVHLHEEGIFLCAKVADFLWAGLRAGESADAARIADGRAEPLEGSPRGVLRVLIVDDDQDATDLLAETLASAGYEITVAYDGPEALRSVAVSPPNVALIDIGLPVMDGYELAARLREERPPSELRLIALTGYGQECEREHSRKVGFDVHLVKPVDFDTLRRAIEAHAE
jgi:CheY-like chemotaxis protein